MCWTSSSQPSPLVIVMPSASTLGACSAKQNRLHVEPPDQGVLIDDRLAGGAAWRAVMASAARAQAARAPPRSKLKH